MKKEKKKASGFEIIVSLIIVAVAVFMIYRMATGGLNKKEEPVFAPEDPYGLNITFYETMPNNESSDERLATLSSDMTVDEYIKYYFETYMVKYPGVHEIVNYKLNTVDVLRSEKTWIYRSVFELNSNEKLRESGHYRGGLIFTDAFDKMTWKSHDKVTREEYEAELEK